MELRADDADAVVAAISAVGRRLADACYCLSLLALPPVAALVAVAYADCALDAAVAAATVLLLLIVTAAKTAPDPGVSGSTGETYLLEVACYNAPPWWRVPHSHFMEHAVLSGRFSEKSLAFQKRLLERADIGETVAVPPAMHRLPPVQTHAASTREAEIVLFDCMERLLRSSGVEPRDVDVVVTNCSIFNPAPSLAAMLVHRFRLRPDVRSFNLAGMGCAANAVALDVARACLRRRPGYAAVLSTENITENWYFGDHESMLVSNILFRAGCGAVLLSSHERDRKRAKLRLLHLVRTHRAGAGDREYRAAFQEEDPAGARGVSLSRYIMDIAAQGLALHMRQLAPLVLPYWAQLLYLFRRSVLRSPPRAELMSRRFRHVCIHTGGKAVIQAVQKGLRLSSAKVEPARMTLFRFGNTSSASTWYEVQYLESKGRLRRGESLWQICLGSGFKCNSVVWIVNRDLPPPDDNAWSDCIAEFPLDTPSSSSSSANLPPSA